MPKPTTNYLLPKGCYSIQYRPNQPVPGVDHFDGTLRVTRDGDQIRASADLYQHPAPPAPGSEYSPGCGTGENNQTGRLPVFARAAYRFYLEVGRLDEDTPSPGKVRFQVQVHAFDPQTKQFGNQGSRTITVVRSQKEEEQSAKALARRTGGQPKAVAQRARGFAGEVLDEEAVNVVGTVTLRLLDDRYVRAAVVEIDALDGTPPPLNSGPVYLPDSVTGKPIRREVDWKQAFDSCDWYVECVLTKKSKRKSLGGAVHGDVIRPWQDAELHEEMSVDRDIKEQQLDREWHYHVLCVGTFANPQYERGVLYDVGGSDLNHSPREGVAVAGRWIIPKDWKEQWKALQGLSEFSEAKQLYFRTAVHEIGHAMGLDHDVGGAHFMNTTDTIESVARSSYSAATHEQADAVLEATLAEAHKTLLEQVSAAVSPAVSASAARTDSAEAARRSALQVFAWKAEAERKKAQEAGDLASQAQFPNNIDWSFSDKDKDLLRHAPDVFVRPGTFAENLESIGSLQDDAPAPAPGLALELVPLWDSVPFGAPARVKLKLTNTSDEPQNAPASLNLKTGYVSGTVTDPSGANVRPFYPVMLGDDMDRISPLAAGESLYHSATLLRGHQGALFRGEGVHTVRARVIWFQDGKKVFVEGQTDVRVEAPVDTPHKIAALSLISTPEAFLSLALGANKDVPEGTSAIQACLDVPVLRPHLAVVEIKWLLKRLLTEDNRPNPDEVYRSLQQPTVLSVSEINRLIQLFEPLKGNYTLPSDPQKDLAEAAIAELARKRVEVMQNERFYET